MAAEKIVPDVDPANHLAPRRWRVSGQDMSGEPASYEYTSVTARQAAVQATADHPGFQAFHVTGLTASDSGATVQVLDANA